MWTTIDPWGLRNQVACIEASNPYMVQLVQFAFSAFVSSFGVTGHTKFWQALERNQQFGENESTDIGMSQRLRKEGNARINLVLAMRQGVSKLINKVHILRKFECLETALHIAVNTGSIEYTDSRSSKGLHWLSKSESMKCSATYYTYADMLEMDAGVAWVSLPITRIFPQVA